MKRAGVLHHWRPRRRALVLAAGLAIVLAVPAAAARAAATPAAAPTSTSSACPWVASHAPVSQRVAQLIGHMTLADEISMVEGHGTSNPYVFYTPAIPSLCIPAVGLEDGPSGVADGLTGVTQLPAGVTLAATWDPSLAKQYGTVIGAEEAGKGASSDLGPTVNIDRDPRWGRSFEALSEDPFLNSALDVPEIDGIQRQDVEDQVKHFDAYNQETNRNTPADNVIVSDRALHEIYMPSFDAAVTQANAASVMCAYSYVNGSAAATTPSSQQRAARRVGLPRFRDVGLRRAALDAGRGRGHRPGAAVQHLLRHGAADRHPERHDPAERAEHDARARLHRDVPVRVVQR